MKALIASPPFVSPVVGGSPSSSASGPCSRASRTYLFEGSKICWTWRNALAGMPWLPFFFRQ